MRFYEIIIHNYIYEQFSGQNMAEFERICKRKREEKRNNQEEEMNLEEIVKD